MNIQQTTEKKTTLFKVKDFDEDPGPYCTSFGFDLSPLIQSIENHGLINPPLVAKNRKGRVDIVVGYRRIMALKSVGWREVPCRDLSDSGLTSLELLLLNLYDNLATRQFNEVEKAMTLNRLNRYVSKKELMDIYMPLMNLPSHGRVLDVFLRMEDLERPLKEAVAGKRVSFQTVKTLINMDRASRAALFKWLDTLRFTFNQQTQFIEQTADIALKEGKKIPELLNEDLLLRVLEDKKLNTPQKAKAVLDRLRSRRFPLLTQSEKAFQAKVTQLGLPEGVRVYHPPFFEDPDYRLEIRFDHGQELRQKLITLLELKGLDDIGDPWQNDS